MSAPQTRLEQVFADAVATPRDRRAAFLDNACAGDAALRREVESLLRHHDSAAGFLESPAFEIATISFGPGAGDGEPATPDRIGRYRILGVLGAGGMGVVYRAEQESPRREVALKVIRAGAASRQLLRRFQHESQILARLQHPGIAQVYEAGAFDAGAGPQPFFAMELVRGEPLTAWADAHALGGRQRLELLARVCDAAHHAHLKSVVHRDLKPGNILVDEHGQPKILDFGVARVTDGDIQATTLRTDVGQLIGTVPYMSPEQIAGDAADLDARSDVYALGVILFELLTGRLPYDLSRKMIHEAARVIREVEPTRLSSFDRALRGDVETIASKALAKEKERRYQSAAELAADIRRHLRDDPIAARPPTTAYQLRKFARRNKALVAGVAAAFVALAAGVVATSVQAVRATRAERLALAQAEEARRNADVAHAVADFLAGDILAAASPEFTPDREMTVRQALDLAAERIRTRDFGSPAVAGGIHLAMGDAYSSLGASERAAEHFAAAAARWSEVDPLGEQAIEAASRHADALVGLDRIAEGRPLFERAVADAERALGAEHPATLRILASYAARAVMLGVTPEQAVALCTRVLDAQRNLLGPDHPETLKTTSYLAGALDDRGRHEDALALRRAVLEGRLRTLGEDHPRTLIARESIAVTLALLSRHDEAIREAAAAHEGFVRILGPNATYTLSAARRLASALRKARRLDEARVLLESTLEGYREVDGPDHVQTLNAANDLALVTLDAGDAPAAAQQLAALADQYERTLGSGHRYTVIARNNLADALIRSRRYADAETAARAAYDHAREALGRGDDIALTASNWLAYALNMQGRFDEAAAVMQDALPLKEALYGPTDARTRMQLVYLAGSKMNAGRVEDALADLRLLVARTIDAFGESHAEAAAARLRLGAGLLQANRPADAEAELALAAAIAAAAQPDNAQLRVSILIPRARALAALARFEDAEALLLEAEPALRAGPAHAQVAKALEDLYTRWAAARDEPARLEQAAQWKPAPAPAP